MGLNISRSELLSGDISGRSRPIRPPWSLPEMAFRSTCNSCGNCLEKCPTRIIEFGRGRIPVIDFNHGECVFCGECTRSCETGALHQSLDQAPWHITAVIDNKKCLAYQNVECRSCQDPCENRAIRFLALAGNISKPDLDAEQCSGCGACFSVCPANAISISSNIIENNNGY